MQKRFNMMLWIFLWLIVTIALTFALPGFSEFDAGKYMQIAQHMQRTGNYMIPYYYGIYSDKPPLLFWLILAGWHVFGITKYWMQLLVMLFSMGIIMATIALAKRLWRDQRLTDLVPYVLIGSLYFIWLAKQIRVDVILTFSVVSAWWALFAARQSKVRGYWLLYSLAVGLGLYTKGPVVFLFTLLPMVFLVFDKSLQDRWQLISKIAIYTLLSVCMLLLWAIPAALTVGVNFSKHMFFQQLINRQHSSKHHVEFAFYLWHLPIWFLPWVIYWPLWHGAKKAWQNHFDLGVKLCFAIIVPSLIVFSVFSEKLPHYVFPLYPIFALLFAKFIDSSQLSAKRSYQWPMALLLFVVSVILICLPLVISLLGDRAQIRLYFVHSVSWYLADFINGVCIWLVSTENEELIKSNCVAVCCNCFITAFY